MANLANVKVVDYTPQVEQQMEGNIRTALTALGLKAVELIQDGMDPLYGRPIWDTGFLRGDVHHYVENNAPNTVDVGNAADYAHFVHEGTIKCAHDHISGTVRQANGRRNE